MTTDEKVKVIKSLRELAFIVETMAHLQGQEYNLLPAADRARALILHLEAEMLPPPKEKKHCTQCGRSLDFQGYCVKCDGDIYEY